MEDNNFSVNSMFLAVNWQAGQLSSEEKLLREKRKNLRLLMPKAQTLSQSEQIELYKSVREQGMKDLLFLSRDILGYERVFDEIHELPIMFLLSDEFDSKLWLSPRESIKSSIMVACLILYFIINNPDITILLAGETEESNQKWIRVLENIIESHKLFRLLYGDLKNTKSWTESYFTVETRTNIKLDVPTVSCASIEKPRTGGHWDIIIVDDIVTERNYVNFEQREKAIRFVKNLKILAKENCKIFLDGTLYDIGDVYGWIMQDELDRIEQGVDRDFGVFVASVYDIEEYEKGNRVNMFPQLYSDKRLANLERTLKEFFFYQYMNNPVAGEMQKFKIEWIRKYKPEDLMENLDGGLVRPKQLNIFTAFDPGEGISNRASYSAIITLGIDNKGNKYVLDARRGRWSAPEVIQQFFNVYLQFNPMKFVVEEISFQSWLIYSLNEEQKKRGLHLPITPINPEKATTRVFSILSLVRWFVPEPTIFFKPEQRDLIDDLLKFDPNERKIKDYLSAMSYLQTIVYPPVKPRIQLKKTNWIISPDTGIPIRIK